MEAIDSNIFWLAVVSSVKVLVWELGIGLHPMPCPFATPASWLLSFAWRGAGSQPPSALTWWLCTNLVDPASSHMLVSKIKPCMSQYKLLYGETANGSLKQL